ncbi:type VII secretion protein EccB [Granulicoccus phenolivorans]|uniref:type VII secretion protein EccB n=1 Tax=Granulicoccus phenolivorans TaxID=266854 RepID=UPI0003F99220|nr:type VII secretion protein EccB [Granulicoccus phenolivorans]
MATRKDLLKAHSFITQRLIAALVSHDPDNPEAPLRRLNVGMFVGVMIAIVVLAGFGLVGLIRPGNSTAWRTDKTVIIDSTSGGVLVYLGGKLYPTRNITSAKLAAGSSDRVMTVKAAAMKDYPREATIGIPGAPGELPEAKDLGGYPIRTCSVVPAAGAASPQRLTTLQIAEGAVPAGSVSLVARSAAGAEYLIAEGRAYPMPDHAIAIQLGFAEQAITPGDAWLDALPKGPALEPVRIPNVGSPAAVPVGGRSGVVGTVFRVPGSDGSGGVYYVLLSDGLSEIAPLDAAVLQARDRAREVGTLTAQQAGAALSRQTPRLSDPALPATMPTRSHLPGLADQSVCATWPAAGQLPRIAVGVPAPAVSARNPDSQVADAVHMPALRGALVKVEGSLGPDDPGTLITGGKRYGLADQAAKNALGYGEVTPVTIPANLLRLVPEGLAPGRSLSIEDAIRVS